MVIWGKGVLNSAIQDVGSIITKYKEQCAHMMQAQILMAQLATISIEAELKTIDGQYKNLLSSWELLRSPFLTLVHWKFTFSSTFRLNNDFMWYIPINLSESVVL